MLIVLLATLVVAAPQTVTLDETPAAPGDWGYRPDDGETCHVNPPAFSFRPQKRADLYAVEVARDAGFADIVYTGTNTLPCYCPPRALHAGTWHWRFRYRRGDAWSAWSAGRRFTIVAAAVEFPMPAREELLARVPATHPRLFVRPEQIPALKAKANGDGKEAWNRLRADAEKLLTNPPPTAEPRKYPAGVERLSGEWKEIWWGNRVYTIKVLEGAATLGFVWSLSGEERFGREGVRLLMAAAAWDPVGSTGYRYNDEAGMPYAYHFSRAYTFLHPLLTDEQRATCREVMRARGREMYEHLCPSHLWRPFSSHSNRAWHFLGEVGIAFLGEIPEAADWLHFAVNVFFVCYPVWSDSDGGWHEGISYYRSYLGRFTWWADVMKTALAIDAYQKPFFASAGYFPLYVQPPGTEAGGFGDLCSTARSDGNVPLLAVFAAQAKNPHWQWYVEAHGGAPRDSGYIDFLRGSAGAVPSSPPSDLPTSRVFRGVGIACLNSTLLNARDNIGVIFKSSPFGSVSHGYDAQNAFLVYASGKRLLIRSGERDIHGSPFHRNWMWQTKSENTLTFEDISQRAHAWEARGRIAAFVDAPEAAYVRGEAGEAYGPAVPRFARHLVYLKGTALLVWDVVALAEPKRVTSHLHALAPFTRQGDAFTVENPPARCSIAFLWKEPFETTATDTFDVQPAAWRPQKNWHLRAQTKERRDRYSLVTWIDVGTDGAVTPHPSGLAFTRGDFTITLMPGPTDAPDDPAFAGTVRVTARTGDAPERLILESPPAR